MKPKLWIILAMASSSVALSGCAPIVLAGIGAGAVVVADKAVEEEKGGDGLF